MRIKLLCMLLICCFLTGCASMLTGTPSEVSDEKLSSSSEDRTIILWCKDVTAPFKTGNTIVSAYVFDTYQVTDADGNLIMADAITRYRLIATPGKYVKDELVVGQISPDGTVSIDGDDLDSPGSVYGYHEYFERP